MEPANPQPQRVPFNRNGFRALLEGFLDAGYRFAPFVNDPLKHSHPPDTRPLVYMRHDIDFDSRYARELAKIESEVGVSATYFVQLRSAAYNVLSPPVIEDINAILDGGHRVGLHLDATLYETDVSGPAVQRELAILAGFIPDVDVTVISHHRPGPDVLRRESAFPSIYAQTYEERFIGSESDPTYFADSAYEWAKGNPLESEVFRARRDMQVLTHPIWWIAEGRTVDDKLASFRTRRDEVISEMASDWRIDAEFARVIGTHPRGIKAALRRWAARFAGRR